ncbi:hypothetical protein BT63DRAFT_420923 [Microthyrium microscopicum]|uniref:Uncharacterized protein n=1 Tax=Microthyrium microscopicum TaxID=703497 RepID=A0A6A6UKC8_9PEZI|nr:hypothetical protein BT63DRAFT_420923 [Microthyrium microscopicum]
MSRNKNPGPVSLMAADLGDEAQMIAATQMAPDEAKTAARDYAMNLILGQQGPPSRAPHSFNNNMPFRPTNQKAAKKENDFKAPRSKKTAARQEPTGPTRLQMTPLPPPLLHHEVPNRVFRDTVLAKSNNPFDKFVAEKMRNRELALIHQDGDYNPRESFNYSPGGSPKVSPKISSVAANQVTRSPGRLSPYSDLSAEGTNKKPRNNKKPAQAPPQNNRRPPPIAPINHGRQRVPAHAPTGPRDVAARAALQREAAQREFATANKLAAEREAALTRKAAEEQKAAAAARKAADDEQKAAAARKAADEQKAAAARKVADEQKAAAARKAAEEEKAAARKALEEEKAAAARKALEEEKVAARKALEEEKAAAVRKALVEKKAAEEREASRIAEAARIAEEARVAKATRAAEAARAAKIQLAEATAAPSLAVQHPGRIVPASASSGRIAPNSRTTASAKVPGDLNLSVDRVMPEHISVYPGKKMTAAWASIFHNLEKAG